MRVTVNPEPEALSRLPQCSAAYVPDRHIRMENFEVLRRQRAVWHEKDPERCVRGARWWIDGQPFCNMHAGSLALEELLRQQESEKAE